MKTTTKTQQLTPSEYAEMENQQAIIGGIAAVFACIGLFVVCRQLLKLFNWLLFK
ncbi:MAG: hypothetical protein GY739_19355 [Mesoflavibacter sp.]|nr:hypothetical protein [Mesoflavibacter sp.]